ncbi:S24 family peptidase [Latilactobacillus sakei]|uniref:S24 family peptidase n=1 Tax=Latilactobacillus sakei TaxID=1599 RepID=UPI00345C7903
MNSFKDRLNTALALRKISKAELSRRTGIGRNSISDYTNGKYEAKQDYVFLIAKALDVSESWLMGFDTPMEKGASAHETITSIFNKLNDLNKDKVISFAKDRLDKQNSIQETVIPFSPRTKQQGTEVTIYGAVSAGTGEMLGDGVTTKRCYFGRIPHHDYALTVNGDSMKPMFEDGQIIFVENVEDDMEFLDGQIVIAILNGESYIKKLRIMKNCAQLISLNAKYDPIEVSADDDFKIKGKVIL